ncbi:MAG: M20 aminoacylase family protein [Burkholderiaceae bacterium]
MQTLDIPKDLIGDLIRVRRDIHAHPEMAFKENRTSDLIAAKLTKWGVQFDRGIAKTGIVATIRAGTSSRAIALRCDMDALPISERSGKDYASTCEGVMHACGHDGHTTMLLGAARHLSQALDFDGSVHLVFQPAEENEGGGRVMVDEGLFERYPVEAVYGMHNWPGVDVGTFGVHTGPTMAAVDLFEIELLGTGAHAAMPHLGDDPIVAAGELITALQTVVSRAIDPAESVVLSITQIHAGNNLNVVQPKAVLHGTCRYFEPVVSQAVEQRMKRLIDGICTAHGLQSKFKYDRKCPAVINSVAPARVAALAASDVVGVANVKTDLPPSMGCEDFAHMLSVKQGCYVWIGNGPGEGGCLLHSNRYDFNDDILGIGVRYWAALVRRCLPVPTDRL